MCVGRHAAQSLVLQERRRASGSPWQTAKTWKGAGSHCAHVSQRGSTAGWTQEASGWRARGLGRQSRQRRVKRRLPSVETPCLLDGIRVKLSCRQQGLNHAACTVASGGDGGWWEYQIELCPMKGRATHSRPRWSQHDKRLHSGYNEERARTDSAEQPKHSGDDAGIHG